MTVVPHQGAAPRAQKTDGGLYDILELILDRGLVIDAFVRVSLVGIEILRVDARVVVASVDTYLRFAEACNRLDLENKGGVGLPDLVGDTVEKGARGKSRGALSGALETLTDSFKQGRDEESAQEERPRARRSSGSTTTRRKEES
ncbi:gas vesicle structural protein GvpA [Streptomyces sp. ME01-24h]|nr:gas vesicle structural protein GvpA [Streptomyces sp. ME19-03-3]MDX3235947.1 gas vesicle structural protein GvpA [Streptomyces sp. ME03-5709C]MDX3354034.1 gas vesicle structural protein GvpA [Streptomyces sp. ME01-24h]